MMETEDGITVAGEEVTFQATIQVCPVACRVFMLTMNAVRFEAARVFMTSTYRDLAIRLDDQTSPVMDTGCN